MKAIILAAGRGSRMKEWTRESPKCLVPLAGQPLLEWQLKALRESGVQDIGIVRGYLADVIEAPGTYRFDNQHWNETNMVMTLLSAESWLASDDCIISYSDIVYPSETVISLMEAEGDIVITYDTLWLTLWQARFEDPLSDAESFRVNEANQLLEIGASVQHIQDIEGQYMGLLKFTPKGWKIVKPYLHALSKEHLRKLDMTSLLRGLLQAGAAIQAVPVRGNWCEVDHAEDLTLYEQLLQDQDAELVRTHLQFLVQA